ncbi:Uncharacterised protein [Mycobacteroides abscessus subsp. abscessus]|nr:Uncharacterised protein [Mycobacteroides abscessus subsp. abscessus]
MSSCSPVSNQSEPTRVTSKAITDIASRASDAV